MVDTVRAELAALTATYRDAQQALAAHSAALKDAVVNAIDLHGIKIADAARILGVSTARIHRIIVQTEAHAL